MHTRSYKSNQFRKHAKIMYRLLVAIVSFAATHDLAECGHVSTCTSSDYVCYATPYGDGNTKDCQFETGKPARICLPHRRWMHIDDSMSSEWVGDMNTKGLKWGIGCRDGKGERRGGETKAKVASNFQDCDYCKYVSSSYSSPKKECDPKSKASDPIEILVKAEPTSGWKTWKDLLAWLLKDAPLDVQASRGQSGHGRRKKLITILRSSSCFVWHYGYGRTSLE